MIDEYLHSHLKQIELANKLQVSRQRVSLVINKFRNMYRKELNQNR